MGSGSGEGTGRGEVVILQPKTKIASSSFACFLSLDNLDGAQRDTTPHLGNTRTLQGGARKPLQFAMGWWFACSLCLTCNAAHLVENELAHDEGPLLP